MLEEIIARTSTGIPKETPKRIHGEISIRIFGRLCIGEAAEAISAIISAEINPFRDFFRNAFQILLGNPLSFLTGNLLEIF